MRAHLRLLRVSLAPSAAADALAGLVLACGGFPPAPRAWWLVGASLGVYHGALALNDWADRAHDARTRPGRPIPSGAVSARAALALGAALIAAGLACAALAAPQSALWMGAVALLAVLYDVRGRGPWSGPLLLAACRAGNLGAGMFWAARAGALEVALPALVAPAALYGAYVFLVSRLGRLEDGEDPRPIGARPRRLLRLAALALVLVALEPSGLARWERVPALLVALLGAAGLWRAAAERTTWERADVERAMGLALRRLLVFAACVALLALRAGSWDAPLAATAILAGYPLAHALRRAFPPS